MNNGKPWLLEMRLFTLVAGTRTEFDRISREETIPLMRRLGITVIAHGPSLNNDNGYFLLRAFASEADRVELSQSVYATAEWTEKYDAPIMAMIDDYDTAVMPVARDAVQRLAEPSGS